MTVRKSGNAPCAWQAPYVDLYISFDTCECVCRSNRIYRLMAIDWSNILRFGHTTGGTHNHRLRNNNDHDGKFLQNCVTFRQITQTLFHCWRPHAIDAEDHRDVILVNILLKECFVSACECWITCVFVRSAIARLNDARWCGLFHIIWEVAVDTLSIIDKWYMLSFVLLWINRGLLDYSIHIHVIEWNNEYYFNILKLGQSKYVTFLFSTSSKIDCVLLRKRKVLKY